jgi:Uma2 family endonuclease
MNAPARAIETHVPYRFTWDDVLRMVETGILPEGSRVELIEGELIEVSPESLPHARTKRWLNRALIEALGREWEVAPDSPAVLSSDSAPEPDLYVFPASVDDRTLRGSDIVLAIEVSVSSLAFDLKRKAALYARHGVQEYWVVDVYARRVLVHTEPGETGYASVAEALETDSIAPRAVPAFSLNVTDLPKPD